jgi:hypothetical protein
MAAVRAPAEENPVNHKARSCLADDRTVANGGAACVASANGGPIQMTQNLLWDLELCVILISASAWRRRGGGGV